MVVNGIVFGITVYGDVTAAQLARFTEVAKTVELLRKQLAELFDEHVADALVARLGENNVELRDGCLTEEENAHLAALASLGFGKEAKK